jgi:hypothetical protein
MTSDDSAVIDAQLVRPSTAEAAGLASARRRNEWSTFWFAVAILAASFLLECGSDGRIRIPWVEVALPGVCWSKRCLGLDCPGCGMTRCFVSLAHGDVAAAAKYHPFGIVLFVLVAVQIPYRLLKLRRLAQGRDPWDHPLLDAVLWVVAAGLLGQWILRLCGVI